MGEAAALCARVTADMPALAVEVTRSIREALPEYECVPFEDHLAHVFEQQDRLLAALQEGRGPDADDLHRAAALGRLRAVQGVSVEGLIGAYHVGNRELWRLLDSYATTGRSCLPALAALMWQAIAVVTAEIASAHSSVSQARQSQVLTLRHRLVELLHRDDLEGEAVDVAVTLGFQAEATFLAACLALPSEHRSAPITLGEGPSNSCTLVVARGAMLVVLTQGVGEDAISTVCAEAFPTLRLGIGLERPGLSGARESIQDAELCLAATSEGSPARRFRDDWLRACVLAQRERLEPILAVQRDIVLAHPRLVETLDTYVDTGFSLVETARIMHMHPNSVAYRLDRWLALTGWNPRTFKGLSQSILATSLV